MKLNMPPALKSGDTIGVMAPASYVERADIEAAKAFIEKRGYSVFIHPQTYEREHQSAGTHEQKAAAFHELWAREDISAIWCAGGGNRTLHLLEHIDFNALKTSAPKITIGFSDATALLNALYVEGGAVSIHGPVFKNAHSHAQIDDLFHLLNGHDVQIDLSGAETLQGGSATGALIGGNLSVFQYLPGSLSGAFWDGALLFLEDCNEELSRIDRVFAHLKRCGVFGAISGLILGEFINITDSGRAFGYSLENIVREHVGDSDIPVIFNSPFGHGDVLHPIPIGLSATLNADQKTLKPQNF